ncbi:hypothetical protein MYX06_02370 [Patescibacteria group bacterium AH-259-L05]|nr:hypothetical protein [Patescibacteria group bacterium AH-259-L05]
MPEKCEKCGRRNLRIHGARVVRKEESDKEQTMCVCSLCVSDLKKEGWEEVPGPGVW